MKKIIYVFLMTMTSAIALAQDTPGGTISGINKRFYYFVVTVEGEYKILNIWAQSDVLLGGETYRLYSGRYENDNHMENLVFLRQDGMKFFCYDVKNETKRLLFDFGLQKGSIYTNDENRIEYKVTDVRDTVINSKKLRLIELQSVANKYNHDIWLESIGSIYTGILSNNTLYKNVSLLGMDYRYLFYPNNQYIKTADMKVTELNWEGGLDSDEDRRKYEEWLDAPTNLNAEFYGDTLYIWGRLNIDCDLQSYAACFLKENQVSFKIFSNGDIDCYEIYEIETRIPGFSRGKYNIELINKTVELENTGSDYTSLKSVPTSSALNNSALYDLSGRRVDNGQQTTDNGQIPRGIYIQDGRKVAVK